VILPPPFSIPCHAIFCPTVSEEEKPSGHQDRLFVDLKGEEKEGQRRVDQGQDEIGLRRLQEEEQVGRQGGLVGSVNKPFLSLSSTKRPNKPSLGKPFQPSIILQKRQGAVEGKFLKCTSLWSAANLLPEKV
jgi:hypothetical protein